MAVLDCDMIFYDDSDNYLKTFSIRTFAFMEDGTK